MAMSDEQFEALVKRLEGLPAPQYRTRLALLAALGYVFIFFVLAVCILGVIGIVAVLLSGHSSVLLLKPAILLLVLILAIVRSLWVRFPPPEGVPLSRAQAPELYGLLDSITTRLQAPVFHHVLLDESFNAGVLQMPRLGVLGWQVNYLVLGLPLMQSVNPERFAAIIAHEIGHISGNHSRFSGWIYRVRTTYRQILGNLHGSKAFDVFASFFRWYAPYFYAYSFVLARANEYEADRCAAEVAGARTAAEALMDISVKARLFGKYLQPVYEQSARLMEPPVSAFLGYADLARSGIGSERQSRWLRDALDEKPEVADTHPALPQRLAALGFDAGAPTAPGLAPITLEPTPGAQTAADVYLGKLNPATIAAVGSIWRSSIFPAWQHSYNEGRSLLPELQALEQKAQQGTLTEDEARRRVDIVVQTQGPAAGLPLLQAYLADHDGDAGAHAVYGDLLLDMGDPVGIAELERAMEIAPAAIVKACERIVDYLEDCGRPGDAAPYAERMAARKMEEEAAEKRMDLGPADIYLPHGLPVDEVQPIATPFGPVGAIAEVYLVRKSVEFTDGKPIFVLGLVSARPPSVHKNDFNEIKGQVAAQIAQNPPRLNGATVLTYLDTPETAAYLPKIRAVEGSLIFSRTATPTASAAAA